MEFLGDNLSKLSDLLKEADEHEHRPTKEMQRPSGAGTMTVKTGASAAVKMPGQGEEDKDNDKAAIWDEKDVPDEEALVDEGDDRPTPRYEFAYKQSVSTEDAFLGLGDNSPATSDCTHLVVKVHFPGSTMKDISLDVTKNRIKATSKTHRLFTYLPVTVQKDKGVAKFDTKKNVLSITLPIIHELGGL